MKSAMLTIVAAFLVFVALVLTGCEEEKGGTVSSNEEGCAIDVYPGCTFQFSSACCEASKIAAAASDSGLDPPAECTTADLTSMQDEMSTGCWT